MDKITHADLFNALYSCPTEDKVDEVVSKYPALFIDSNWAPLGGNENMFGIVRNQQSSPIAALVEKEIGRAHV